MNPTNQLPTLALLLVLITTVQISTPHRISSLLLIRNTSLSPRDTPAYSSARQLQPSPWSWSHLYFSLYEGDGSAAFDRSFRDALQNLDPESLSKINLKVAINILPYHITSEKITIAVRYVQEKQAVSRP